MPEPDAPLDAPGAFTAFFDDAAVFPPGDAPLDRAVREHLARRNTGLGACVGPLLLTADRLAEAARLAGQVAAEPLRVGVVTTPDGLSGALATIDRVAPAVRVTGLELAIGDADLDRVVGRAAELTERFDVHVELPVRRVPAGAQAQLAGTPVRLKVRTGGLVPEAFPGVADLAAAIGAAVRAGVPFKLTAGLHRAVRHTDDATGFPHHGFLNIAVATAMAQEGADDGVLAGALAEREGAAVAAGFRERDTGWRRHFTSFGTCSIAEPVSTLAELGFTTPPRVPHASGTISKESS